MTQPSKDQDKIASERRTFKKKLPVYLEKKKRHDECEKEVYRLLHRKEQLENRERNLQDLKDIAEKIQALKDNPNVDWTKQTTYGQRPIDGNPGSHAYENEEWNQDDLVKQALKNLRKKQQEIIEKHFKDLATEKAKTPLSPDEEKEMIKTFRESGFGDLDTLKDVKALEKALKELEKGIKECSEEAVRKETLRWKLQKELEEYQKQLKEHAEKGEVEKCGVDCKYPEHGKCDNPAIENGRCWIPEHQSR